MLSLEDMEKWKQILTCRLWRCYCFRFPSSIFLPTLVIGTRACVCELVPSTYFVRAKNTRKLKATHRNPELRFSPFSWDGIKIWAREKLFHPTAVWMVPKDEIRRVMFIFNVVHKRPAMFVFVHSIFVLDWRTPHKWFSILTARRERSANFSHTFQIDQSQRKLAPHTHTTFRWRQSAMSSQSDDVNLFSFIRCTRCCSKFLIDVYFFRRLFVIDRLDLKQMPI